MDLESALYVKGWLWL